MRWFCTDGLVAENYEFENVYARVKPRLYTISKTKIGEGGKMLSYVLTTNQPRISRDYLRR